MCAASARHRASRKGESGSERGFWMARDLVDGFELGRATRHARKAPSKYALHVGRVGALAVSLGVGFAVANSAVAYAETDADSSVSKHDTDSVAAGPTKPAKSASGAEQTQTDTTDTGDDDADDADDVDDGPEAQDPTDDVSIDETDGDGTEPAGDPDLESAGQDLDDASAPVDDPERVQSAQPVSDSSAPRDTIDVDLTDDSVVQSDDELVVDSVDQEVAGGEGPETSVVSLADATPVALKTRTEKTVQNVGFFSALVSDVVSPLADPNSPAPSPILESVLAWVRRQITHTFFNRAPVYGPITSEQMLTGQLLIDLHATDPNGDPLSYDIIQPEHGWVFRDLITGKFVYTPYALVTGDPLVDSFKIVVRDDSEHLTGVLGGIQNLFHGIAKAFGLAQADNVTVTVPVFVNPVIELPPLVTPIAGPGFTIGGDPAKLVSAVSIVDGDSDYLSEVILKIVTLGQDGDVLGYVAPTNNPIVATWDAASKTLTLNGVATKAQYEEALKAVTFSATQGALLVRGVSISATDDDGIPNVLPGVVPVAVWPAIKLPPLVTPLPGGGYTIGDDPAKLVSAVEIADGDSDYLSKLVLTIATLAQNGDVLGYVAPQSNPIEAVWDAGTRTLTLSGVATKAQYEEALKAVTFSATGGALLVRGVSISATDDDGVENLLPGLVTVGVWPASNLPPLVTPLPGLGFTLGGDPVKLVSAVDIADGDSDYLTKAILKIATLAQSGDVLGYAAPSGNPITAEWDAGTRTLTLSGLATKAQYEEALKAVTFTATGGALLVRGVSISVTDDDGIDNIAPGFVTVGVWLASELPPLVTPVGAPTYTLGSSPVELVTAVDIVDGDSDFLAKAVLKIALLGQSGDVLGYVAPSGNPITAAWDAGSRTLTLSGVATKAQYEAAIKAVTFSATQGAGIVRTITIDVTDNSGVQSLTSGIVLAGARWSLPPLVTPVGTPTYTLGAAPVKLVSSVDIADADSDLLSKAVLKISLLAQNGDALGYVAPGGSPITASWDAGTRTLTLSGVATKAQYEAALKAVTFSATQGAGIVRTITIDVTDNTGVKSLTSGVVLAGARNPLPPLVTPFGGRSYTIGKSPAKPIASVSIADADSEYLSSATVEVTLFGKSGDVLQFSGLAGVPISANYNAGSRTLTLTGTATKAQYEAALEAITFTATSGAWTTRTLAIRVTDEAGVQSAAGLLTLSVW